MSAATPPAGQQEDQASRLRQLVASFREPQVVGYTATADINVMHVNLVSRPPPPPRAVRRVPVVAITSGKGGVGKTSLAVNVCAALSQRHLRVTLIDADLGLANADVMCGLSPVRRLESIVEVGAARRTLRQITVPTPAGFRLVPGSVGVQRMANLPPTERAALLDAIGELEEDNDLVVIDTGAGVHESVLAFVRFADLALVVVTPEPTSIADAYAAIKLLRRTTRPGTGPMPRVLVVVNQARAPEEAGETFERIAGTCDKFLKFRPQMLGYVPVDEGVRDAVRSRVPVLLGKPRSPACAQVRKVAEALAHEAGVRLVRPRQEAAGGWWSRLWG
ncbi:MAG TPA: MinD/ParA family protein [Phycisphaerales bacterium]|nr:MinD/ParA family protein [Phycisphaerales bacterium]